MKPVITAFTLPLTVFATKSTTKEIRSIIKEKNNTEIHSCYKNLTKDYEDSGKSAKMLEGKIVAEFSVDDIGRVSNSELIESTIISPEVFEMCIKPVLESSVYPKSPKGKKAQVKYTFTF